MHCHSKLAKEESKSKYNKVYKCLLAMKCSFPLAVENIFLRPHWGSGLMKGRQLFLLLSAIV